MHHKSKDVFLPAETGSLKAVYMLALTALDATHHVYEELMVHLAETVFEAYANSRCPTLPLSSVEEEDLAVLSIELLHHAAPDLLIFKH